jgi:hypothetical protein
MGHDVEHVRARRQVEQQAGGDEKEQMVESMAWSFNVEAFRRERFRL